MTSRDQAIKDMHLAVVAMRGAVGLMVPYAVPLTYDANTIETIELRAAVKTVRFHLAHLSKALDDVEIALRSAQQGRRI